MMNYDLKIFIGRVYRIMTEVSSVRVAAAAIKGRGRPRVRAYDQVIEDQKRYSRAYYHSHKKLLRSPCQFVSQTGQKCNINTTKIYCHKHAEHRIPSLIPIEDTEAVSR